MITQNFDVEGSVINGSTGILKRIRYQVDEAGRRIALSCVVDVPLMTGEKLTNLDEREAVALQDTVDMDFRHPHSFKRLKIKRTQVPIMPAFAMTAHKAQGQTLSNVIVDWTAAEGRNLLM